MVEKKWVYLFSEVNQVEKVTGGDWEGVRALLGGKGAGLADMTRAGVPVPLDNWQVRERQAATGVRSTWTRTCTRRSKRPPTA
jgi:hypothetical protein